MDSDDDDVEEVVEGTFLCIYTNFINCMELYNVNIQCVLGAFLTFGAF